MLLTYAVASSGPFSRRVMKSSLKQPPGTVSVGDSTYLVMCLGDGAKAGEREDARTTALASSVAAVERNEQRRLVGC